MKGTIMEFWNFQIAKFPNFRQFKKYSENVKTEVFKEK